MRCWLAGLTGSAMLAFGCRSTAPPNPLDLVPYEATAVVELTPARLAGTWVEPLVRALAHRIDVPACVVERAVAARRVVVAYSDQLPADGWLVIVVGGPAPACDALTAHPAGAVWSRDLAPRDGGEDGFFADPGHRARWRRLAPRPVRGVADYPVSAGVLAQADGTLTAADGVDAAMTVRLATGPAAAGVRARIDRFRASTDPTRLGGAWPALQAVTIHGPVPGTPTLELALTLPGAAGADAAPLLATALVSDALYEEPAPCPGAALTATLGATCDRGEIELPVAPRDRLVVDGLGPVSLWPAPTDGSRPLAKLRTVGRDSALYALGLRDGDWVKTIDEVTVFLDDDGLRRLTAQLGQAPVGAVLTARVIRAGHQLTLRVRITP